MRTALILMTAACLAAQSYEPAGIVLARVPQKSRAKRNPLATNPRAPLAGKKLFDDHCAECHGDSAGGSRRGPALSGALIDQASEGDLFWIMTNGVVRRGMPAWSKLPEAQRWQIVSFLDSLKATSGKDSR